LPSGPMTKAMDPTMKIWPGSGRAMELGKWTIWLAMDSARTTLPGAPLSTKYSQQSTERYAHVVDESVEMRVREPDGDRTQEITIRQVRAVSLT